MSLDERLRGSARPTPNEHYNSLPRTSIEGALASFPPCSSTNFGECPECELRRILILRIPVNRGAATLYLPSSSSPQCVRACAGGSAGESPDPPERPAGSLEAEGIRRSRRSTAYRHPRRPPPGPHAPPQPPRPRTPARQCCPR